LTPPGSKDPLRKTNGRAVNWGARPLLMTELGESHSGCLALVVSGILGDLDSGVPPNRGTTEPCITVPCLASPGQGLHQPCLIVK
jgi:hypothetical protein